MEGWNCRLIVIFPDGKYMFDDFQDPHLADPIFHEMVLAWREGRKY